MTTLASLKVLLTRVLQVLQCAYIVINAGTHHGERQTCVCRASIQGSYIHLLLLIQNKSVEEKKSERCLCKSAQVLVPFKEVGDALPTYNRGHTSHIVYKSDWTPLFCRLRR